VTIIRLGPGGDNPASDFQSKWFSVEELAEGGGGKVYKCIRLSLLEEALDFIVNCAPPVPKTTRMSHCAKFVDQLFQNLALSYDGIGAVKVPHQITDRAAIQRFEREIEAMETCKHPALIRLLDHGPLDTLSWFAMEYHPKGNLEGQVESYRGKPLECLLAIRPIIEGTALLHRKGFIHRDIKPKNIFVSSHGKLILGDFGIVFPSQEEGDRLTSSGQTLISRDWVPDWIRFSDDLPEPQVDVFMLAKVLYFMMSGGKNVLASQLDKPKNNLEQLFPDVPLVKELQNILRSCITGDETDCKFADAGELLEVIDQLIDVLSDKARTQLLFNFLSTHSTTQLIITSPHHEGSNYPRLKDIPIFLPFTCRSFRARVRIIPPSPDHEVTSAFIVDGQQSNDTTSKGLRKDPGFWSEEIILQPNARINRGWCNFTLNVTSQADGGRITGFMLYGE